MDEDRTDLFSEIFEKAEPSAPPPQRPRFEYPPEEELSFPPPPDGGPAEKAGTAGTKLLPWLCMVLGAALLVLGVCLLQLVRMNDRLDELQQTVQEMQDVDGLREENEQLRRDLEELQERHDQSVAQSQYLARRLQQTVDEDSTQMEILSIQKQKLDYLWYIGRFMEDGDYPMAALATALSAGAYFTGTVYVNSQQVPINEAQLAEYNAYKQELADRGYLRLAYGSIVDSIPRVPVFPEQWDPGENDDMAALGILWCALDAHFIQGNDNAASQYLYAFPLARKDYQDRVDRLAGGFTLELFQRMKDDLVELDALYIDPDGTMIVGGWTHTLESHFLPFVLPNKQINIKG